MYLVGRCNPELDLGAKWGSKRPKTQKCSESLKNWRVCRNRRYEPNTSWKGSNERHILNLSWYVHYVKHAKHGSWLYRSYDRINGVAGCIGTDVGRYRWTSQSVTLGTTARVTRGIGWCVKVQWQVQCVGVTRVLTSYKTILAILTTIPLNHTN
jgi:hypothetical protein